MRLRLTITHPGGDAYGWVLTGALAVTVTSSYGVLLYAFPIMLVPMHAELGWSPTLLTGGFSATALAAGVAAIPVGRSLDRYGPRVVMTAGSVLAVGLLLAWSRVHDPVTYMLVCSGLGVCSAALFYEPAFAVLAQWFRTRRERTRAFAVITLAGALASSLFVPFTSILVVSTGWRGAITWLAVALGVLTILPHALLLRSRAVDGGARDEGDDLHGPAPTLERPDHLRQALRAPVFRWIAVASFLATLTSFAVAVHLVPLLLERGFTATRAASLLALLGLAKLPGRALLFPLAARASARTALIRLFALQAAALATLCTMSSDIGPWIFIALFGAAEGAATPARAELLAEYFDTAAYGRVSGVLAFILSLGRTAAPIGASIARTTLGGYEGVVWLLLAVTAAAVCAMTRVEQRVQVDESTCEPTAAPHERPSPRTDLAPASFRSRSRLPV